MTDVNRVKMNAMQLAVSKSPTTVGELLQYLEELKAAWSEDDTEFLGSFESQSLCFATQDGININAVATYYACYGLVIKKR